MRKRGMHKLSVRGNNDAIHNNVAMHGMRSVKPYLHGAFDAYDGIVASDGTQHVAATHEACRDETAVRVEQMARGERDGAAGAGYESEEGVLGARGAVRE